MRKQNAKASFCLRGGEAIVTVGTIAARGVARGNFLVTAKTSFSDASQKRGGEERFCEASLNERRSRTAHQLFQVGALLGLLPDLDGADRQPEIGLDHL